MSQLEEVRAVTWDGTASFPMLGLYGRDASGRWVLTREGRYQIPDDAILLRTPAKAQEPALESQPEPLPVPPPIPTPTPAPTPTITADKSPRSRVKPKGRR